jgi:hypothetical protein
MMALLARAFERLDDAGRDRTAAVQDAARSARDLQLTTFAVEQALMILGEANVPPHQAPARLIEVATHLARSRNAPLLEFDDPRTAALNRRVTDALAVGNVGKADALLEKAIRVEMSDLEEAQTQQRKAEAAEDRHARTAVQLLVRRAEVRLTQLEHDAAAGLYAEAGRLVNRSFAIRWRYLVYAAIVLGESVRSDDQYPIVFELNRHGAGIGDPWELVEREVTAAGAMVPTDADMAQIGELITRISRGSGGVFPSWEELQTLASRMSQLGEQLGSISCLVAACAVHNRIAVSTATLTIADPIDISAEYEAVGDALMNLARVAQIRVAASLASGCYSTAGAAWQSATSRERLASKIAEADWCREDAGA